MSTPTPTPGALSAARLRFGDAVTNPHASDDNPIKHGLFVKYVVRTGLTNPGKWFQCTDGNGNFWECMEVVPRHTARPDVDALVKALEGANETIEEMDRIHHDLMDNGPSCTCGDGDEWCVRCARSIKLSDRASSAIKKLDAAIQAALARHAKGGATG